MSCAVIIISTKFKVLIHCEASVCKQVCFEMNEIYASVSAIKLASINTKESKAHVGYKRKQCNLIQMEDNNINEVLFNYHPKH